MQTVHKEKLPKIWLVHISLNIWLLLPLISTKKKTIFLVVLAEYLIRNKLFGNYYQNFVVVTKIQVPALLFTYFKRRSNKKRDDAFQF